MPVINRIADFHSEMAEWRHRIHAHPETAFEEHETAELVSQLLQSFGISVVFPNGKHDDQRLSA